MLLLGTHPLGGYDPGWPSAYSLYFHLSEYVGEGFSPYAHMRVLQLLPPT